MYNLHRTDERSDARTIVMAPVKVARSGSPTVPEIRITESRIDCVVVVPVQGSGVTHVLS
jgi:hypothetical protein